VQTDRRAIVECLLSARYSETEIIDYLNGPLGLSEDEAVHAVRDATGTVRLSANGDSLDRLGGSCPTSPNRWRHS